MASPRSMKETRASTSDHRGGSELSLSELDAMLAQIDPKSAELVEKVLTAPIEPDKHKCVGEMHVLLYEDGTFEFKFPRLGWLTPGRLEAATPLMYVALMRARSAEQRRSEGLPAEVVLHPGDAA